MGFVFRKFNKCSFAIIRLTRNLTSSEAYFKDLTKKWYLLFAYGKTSTLIKVNNYSKMKLTKLVIFQKSMHLGFSLYPTKTMNISSFS